ncbi:holo-ACP synthase [Marinobacterium jannaschii]|uniref:holo-ACP synthase n=1 Tax=Marinobacterium jannaschii TaxID=64970 RepID=UPI0004870B97|nr:holo-ACP synthase [Marinobacterium jannaschii]
MIKGIGTDIIQISRVSKALARSPRLAARILTPQELSQFETKTRKALFLAKRFAAKEAAVKALGTGIGRGVSWQHLTVSHDEWGKPMLEISGGALQRAQQLNISSLHLSYSDEQEYVVAFVVAE